MAKTKTILPALLAFIGILSACGVGGGDDDKPPDPAAAFGTWTWVSGSDAQYQWSVFGTKGVADPLNVPGARQSAVSWTDPNGKLWLFGGICSANYGSTVLLNDLWKYDPVTLEWTWVSGSDAGNQSGIYGNQGIPGPSNAPGSRGNAVTWIDQDGKLWLFGGWGYDSSGFAMAVLNDLWKFDPATLEWTWTSGSEMRDAAGIYGTQGTPDPSNAPGAREGALSWVDSSGKLWLFGGFGYDSRGFYRVLNDLWKYNPTTGDWTWVSGSDKGEEEGVYGTRGTPDAASVPGARGYGVSWVDRSGKLWLFGGVASYPGDMNLFLNDLWMYDPATLEWTWVSGSNIKNQAGKYGTKGTASSSNIPGARYMSVSWIDSTGKLWLFGGYGDFVAGNYGPLNDLWRCDTATLEWTWVSGSDVGNQEATYGTKGLADSSNTPGARYFPVSWVDSSDRLWLFGGFGFTRSGMGDGYLNDLWRYAR